MLCSILYDSTNKDGHSMRERGKIHNMQQRREDTSHVR